MLLTPRPRLYRYCEVRGYGQNRDIHVVEPPMSANSEWVQRREQLLTAALVNLARVASEEDNHAECVAAKRS